MMQFQVCVERLLCVVLVDVSASDMHTDIESCFFPLFFSVRVFLGACPLFQFHEPPKKWKKTIWKLKQILWYLWSISAMLYLVFSPFGYNLSPLSQITSRKFTATLSGTSQPISHLEPHCFLLSESIPYHSKIPQASPIYTVWSLV